MGGSFEVLKVMAINGIRYYLLQVANDTFCVPETWTDRYFNPFSIAGTQDVPFDVRHLAELADLLKSLKIITEKRDLPIDNDRKK